MEIVETYYACFQLKNGQGVVKYPFKTRKEARKFLNDNWDNIKHEQAWTE